MHGGSVSASHYASKKPVLAIFWFAVIYVIYSALVVGLMPADMSCASRHIFVVCSVGCL